MPKQYKKAYNLKRLKNKWYYTVKPNNAKQLYFPLQTSDKLIALDRAKQDIHPYNQFLLTGAITKDEVLSKCIWYKPRGKTAPAKPATLKYYLDKWMEIREVEIRKSTYIRNINTNRAMLNILNPEMPMKDFNLATVENFIKVRAMTVSLSTLNIDLRTLKVFLLWCKDHGIIATIPRIKIKKPPKSPHHFISEIDFKRLLQLESLESIWKNLAKLLYTTGIRKAEIFEGKINCTKLTIEGDDTKGRKQKNILLESWQIKIVQELQSYRDQYLANGYQFENLMGFITHKFQDTYKKLGIYKKGRTNVHSLRHSYGTRMYMLTGDVKIVMELMHHEDESTTMGYLPSAKMGITIDDYLEAFPTDAKHSVFKDNVNRVKQANADVLKELGVA